MTEAEKLRSVAGAMRQACASRDYPPLLENRYDLSELVHTWAAFIDERAQHIEAEQNALRASIELLRRALPDSESAGPDGSGYKYAWDELTGDEQEWVKEVRQQVAALHAKAVAEPVTPAVSRAECYNCGGLKNTARILCPRCAELYAFLPDGQMIARASLR